MPQIKCQLDKERPVSWSWQPFGPAENADCFTLPGNHARGFPVIKICQECYEYLKCGRVVGFTHQQVVYVGTIKRIGPIGDFFNNWNAMMGRQTGSRPTIVCLCGSTRFHDAFHEANLRETLAGRIVLSIGIDTKSDADLLLAGELAPEDKESLDELHLRKIDLADEILVLNVGGYIGQSTSREIAYAREHGKRVRWLEEAEARANEAMEHLYDQALADLEAKDVCSEERRAAMNAAKS